MKTTNFTPANNSEQILTTLPKECTCSICTVLKAEAKKQLGDKRYTQICKELKILAS